MPRKQQGDSGDKVADVSAKPESNSAKPLEEGKWIEFPGVDRLSGSGIYIVASSERQISVHVNVQRGVMMTQRGVALNWEPDRLYIVPRFGR